MLLTGPDAIQCWRSAIGPTKVTKYFLKPFIFLNIKEFAFSRGFYSEPDSFRAIFGLTDTRNSFHGSDSPQSAKREISFFWPEFQWEESRRVNNK